MESPFADVSSLATADSRPRSARGRVLERAKLARRRLSPDALVGLGLFAGLASEAFVTTGGVDLSANTAAEIVLIVLGAGLCAGAVLYTPGTRVWGATALLLFAVLAALTLASISWSVQPADSWVESNRALSYLAAFAGALALARLAPERWPAVVGSVALVTTVLGGYSLLVKVFPATLDPRELLGRLRAPFDYWNAVGLTAALGLPACVWAGARREGSSLFRALAVPAIGVLTVALVLSYSRGALLVAVLGLGLWLVIVPLRLRAVVVLATGLLGGAGAAAWALATHPLTRDLASLPSRTNAGHAFGLVLIVMVAALSGAGFAAAFALDRITVRAELRKRIGTGLVVLVACVPLGGVVALAVSQRGLTGQISHAWHSLTSERSVVGDNAGRLVQVSNSRARYWREGLKVGEHDLLKGAGALGFGTARTRYSKDKLLAQHAHSYLVETFADFGLIGLSVSLALLVALGVAAARAVGIARPLWRRPQSAARDAIPGRIPRELAAERAGLLTLLVIVVVFGLHSAIDWTWFVPGVAVPALVCAGWLAGRGPLASRAGRIRALTPLRLACVALIAALALICAWTIWQPLRSANADQAAIAALGGGHQMLALADARAARERDPVSVQALWDLSAIYAAIGRPQSARSELVTAIRLQPSNPATWLTLGEYDLQAGNPREALRVLQAALYLGPFLPETLSAVAQAQSALRSRAAVALHSRPSRRARRR